MELFEVGRLNIYQPVGMYLGCRLGRPNKRAHHRWAKERPMPGRGYSTLR